MKKQQTRKEFYLALYRVLIVKLSRGRFNYVRELDKEGKIVLKKAFRSMQFNYLSMCKHKQELSEVTIRKALFSFIANIRVKS